MSGYTPDAQIDYEAFNKFNVIVACVRWNEGAPAAAYTAEVVMIRTAVSFRADGFAYKDANGDIKVVKFVLTPYNDGSSGWFDTIETADQSRQIDFWGIA